MFLSFDLRTVFFLFDFFAKNFHYILAQYCRWRIVLYYFDNFFTILTSSINLEKHKRTWRNLCNKLDFRTNKSKEISNIIVDFLDIEFDSIKMKTRFTLAKYARVIKLIIVAFSATNLNYCELDVLVDFLSFCVKIIVFNCFFLISLYLFLKRSI